MTKHGWRPARTETSPRPRPRDAHGRFQPQAAAVGADDLPGRLMARMVAVLWESAPADARHRLAQALTADDPAQATALLGPPWASALGGPLEAAIHALEGWRLREVQTEYAPGELFRVIVGFQKPAADG